MDPGKKIFTVSGTATFESGEPKPGTMHMKDQKGIITFQWIPDKCDNLNLETESIEGSQIFIFLHLLKKITRTIGDNNSTIIRFLVPDSRTNVIFTFPESEIASVEQIFTYLVSENSIVPVQNDPTSFNINIEIDKPLSCPDKFILYNNVAYLQANSLSISKLLEDSKEIDKNPITKQQFEQYFDASGHLKDLNALKNDVFIHGLSDDIRPIAYLYIFNVYKPEYTQKENKEHLDILYEEYMHTLTRWQNQIPDQEQYSHPFYSVIVSDVRRTDRTQSMFTNDGPAHKALQEVLICYALLVADVGYIQGMSDLAAALIQIYFKKVTDEKVTLYDDSEVEFNKATNLIFWSFYGLLKLTGNDLLFKNMDSNRNFIAERAFSLLQTHISPVSKWLLSVQQENLLFTLSPTLLLLRRWFPLQTLFIIWDRLFCHQDPLSYLRFLMTATVALTFPHICMQGSSGGDVSSGYNKYLSTLIPERILQVADALLAKVKVDMMHTQWIFMKYPEEPLETEYNPKFIKIV